MSDEPTWTPAQVRLCDIAPWESNPKRMSKAQAARLNKSSRKLGRAGVLLVGPPRDDGKRPLYDGHQRVKIWQALYGANTAINALQSSRPLTDEERRATSLLTVTAQASFDWDALAGWDFAEISDFGLDADLLAGWNDDAANLREMMLAEEAVPDFQPVDESEQPRLDQKAPVTCPECGAEFVPK